MGAAETLPWRPFSIFLPVKVVSEANQRDHWAVKQRRKKEQQQATALALLAARPCVLFPIRVTFTRYGRRMDPDNLASAFKHVQDAVARYLRIDDGDERMVSWRYSQATGKSHGITVNFAAREEIEAVKEARK